MGNSIWLGVKSREKSREATIQGIHAALFMAGRNKASYCFNIIMMLCIIF